MTSHEKFPAHKMLAYYYYPSSQNTKCIEYTAEDLSEPKAVKGLFDYCQILEGCIEYEGWEFLIEKYGYEKLFEIDTDSGWHDAGNIEDYKAWVAYEMDIMKKHE